MAILGRFYVKARDGRSALERLGGVRRRLQELAPGARISADPPKPYWKIKGLYELACAVDAAGADEAALQRRLADGLGRGWTWLPNGTTGICAADKGGSFDLPHLRWIELDIA